MNFQPPDTPEPLEPGDMINWQSEEIERQQAALLRAKSILMRWCNDGMDISTVRQLERETIAFCAEKS